MKQSITKETVMKIISSAEEVFSVYGYHGSSIRDVTQKAGVNLAAIHYHFGDKQGLYCEVIANRLRPLNQSRLKKLTNASELAGGQAIPLALIIDIFARPFFEMCETSEDGGRRTLRLIGRSMVEPLPFVDKFLANELHPVTMRFGQAIRRHAPKLTTEEFMWRLSFVVGAMHHTLSTIHRMKELTHGLCQNNDARCALRHFVHFAEATLSAPAALS